MLVMTFLMCAAMPRWRSDTKVLMERPYPSKYSRQCLNPISSMAGLFPAWFRCVIKKCIYKEVTYKTAILYANVSLPEQEKSE